jgi:hypothetical protein
VHYDAKRAKKRQIHDVDDRLVETYARVDGAEVLSSSIEYKPFDQPGVLRDAGRNATELFYDGLGRKRREDNPSTGTSRYYHDGFGELRREERGAGAADATVYRRDELGRVRTMSTPDGTVTFHRDAPNGTGKLEKEINFDGTVVHHRYDAWSRLSGSTWVAAGATRSPSGRTGREKRPRSRARRGARPSGAQKVNTEDSISFTTVASIRRSAPACSRGSALSAQR